MKSLKELQERAIEAKAIIKAAPKGRFPTMQALIDAVAMLEAVQKEAEKEKCWDDDCAAKDCQLRRHILGILGGERDE